MRKIVTISAIAAAALALSACGKSETVDASNAVTTMNEADATAGTTNDSMTNVDAAAGANVADANAVVANATDANAVAATNAVDANAAAANVAK
jgi:hypothetical protein